MSDDEAEKVESPFRRAGFIASAVFLALVVLLAVLLLRGGGGPPAGAQPIVTTSAGLPPPGAQRGAGCRPTDTSQQIPAAAPPGVTWQLFKGIALPTSATAGPFTVQGDLVGCHARTPVGALIAVNQLSVRVDIADAWRQVATRAVIPGPGWNTFLREHASAVAGLPTAPGSLAQIAGFKFVTYSPDTAVIDTVTRSPSGSLASSISTVKWTGGDWKLELQPGGTVNTQPRIIPTLDGYTAWGGV